MMTVVGHGDKLYEFGTLTTFAYPIEGSGMAPCCTCALAVGWHAIQPLIGPLFPRRTPWSYVGWLRARACEFNRGPRCWSVVN
jgi:hypothetical protein